MPTNPTAIYTRGWWPSSLADPSNAVYDAGWFQQADVAVVGQIFFPLYGPFRYIGLTSAVAFDKRLSVGVAMGLQLPSLSQIRFAASAPGSLTLSLASSEELHELL